MSPTIIFFPTTNRMLLSILPTPLSFRSRTSLIHSPHALIVLTHTMSLSKRIRRHGRKLSNAIKGSSSSDSDDVSLGNLFFSPNAPVSTPTLASRTPTASNSPQPNSPVLASSGPRVNQLRQKLEPRVNGPREPPPPIPPRHPLRPRHRRHETSLGNPSSRDFQQDHRRRVTSPDQPTPATFQGAARILSRSATDPSTSEPDLELLEPIPELDPIPQPRRPLIPLPALKTQEISTDTGRAAPTAASAPGISEPEQEQASHLPERESSRHLHRRTETSPARVHQELIQHIGWLLARSATDPCNFEFDYDFSNPERDAFLSDYRSSQVPSPLSIPEASQRPNRLQASSVFDPNSRESSLSSLDFERKTSEGADPALNFTTRSKERGSNESSPRSSKNKQTFKTGADQAVKSTADSLNPEYGEDSPHSSDSEQGIATEPDQSKMAAIRASSFFDPSFERFSRLPESQRFTRNEAKQQEAIIHAKLKNAGEPIPPYEFINFIGKGTYGRVYSA